MIPVAVQGREAIWESQLRRMRIGLTAANIIGAITLFVFLQLLVPIPSRLRHDAGLIWLNVSLFVLFGVVGSAIANMWGPRTARELRAWFLSGEPPDDRQRELALRQPLAQTRIDAVLWAAAAALFVTVNAFASITIAFQALFMIALGGLASCALTYLLTERFTREVTATALAGGAPHEPVGPGVAARMIVAWGIAAAIPLLGGALLAASVLIVGHWSATRVAVSILILSGVGLALGFVAMMIAGRSVADPIEAVRGAQRRVQAGDLDTEIPVYDGSEIGLLQAGFNEMTAGLRDRERIREAFGTYLDREVAEHILKEGTALVGEEVEVTVMFTDVRDFTGFAERADAREVVATLNRLFGRIVPIIYAHGGHVDKFVGDGLLAVFGAPRRQPDHADKALEAAIQISREVVNEFGDELTIGVGLNSGTVIAGNVGGGGRLEFSVIGDAVNVAARVEGATRTTGDPILISAQTRGLLSSVAAGSLEKRNTAQLKGKSESVALFAPRALTPRSATVAR
jgi:adenylate cyclase